MKLMKINMEKKLKLLENMIEIEDNSENLSSAIHLCLIVSF